MNAPMEATLIIAPRLRFDHRGQHSVSQAQIGCQVHLDHIEMLADIHAQKAARGPETRAVDEHLRFVQLRQARRHALDLVGVSQVRGESPPASRGAR